MNKLINSNGEKVLIVRDSDARNRKSIICQRCNEGDSYGINLIPLADATERQIANAESTFVDSWRQQKIEENDRVHESENFVSPGNSQHSQHNCGIVFKKDDKEIDAELFFAETDSYHDWTSGTEEALSAAMQATSRRELRKIATNYKKEAKKYIDTSDYMNNFSEIFSEILNTDISMNY